MRNLLLINAGFVNPWVCREQAIELVSLSSSKVSIAQSCRG